MCVLGFFVPMLLPRRHFEDGACMKRRCVPLRADHNLLTPDTHTLSGVRLHPVANVRSDIVASLSAHLNRLSIRDSAVTRRHPPAASPTRRLRFEDETELEAESRYLERQRRRVGQQGTSILVCKPDLNLYVNGRAGVGQREERGLVDRQMLVGGANDSCGTVLGGALNLDLHLHPPAADNRGRSLFRPHINMRTEPIRETYIGTVSPDETSGEGYADQLNLPQATATIDLPVNPYALDQLTTPTFSSSPLSRTMSQNIRLRGTKVHMDQNQGDPPTTELQFGPELNERSPRVVERGLELGMKNLSCSSFTSETAACNRAPPSSGSSSNGQITQPIRAETHSDATSFPEHFMKRDGSSRLSLRRLLSSVVLGRARTGSLDRLSSRTPMEPSDSTPSCHRKSSGLLKKSLSVQSLSVGSPFMQLRKLSSVQNFGLDLWKRRDRSADYRPAAEHVLQRCLSLEDVGCPGSVRSVGRVLQVCGDGTFLLEVNRPMSQKFGFVISRGRGRPDSGLYVEDMADSGTEKLYAGLLAVGDEILEVNGEKVASLTLDQLTHLLTQNISVTLRVLRHWRTPPW